MLSKSQEFRIKKNKININDWDKNSKISPQDTTDIETYYKKSRERKNTAPNIDLRIRLDYKL